MRPILLLLTVCLASCSDSAEPVAQGSSSAGLSVTPRSTEPRSPSFQVQRDAFDDPKQSFELVIERGISVTAGYVKELELGLAVSQGKVVAEDKRFVTGVYVREHEIVFDDETLFIGPNEYGDVELPTRIEIKRDGVYVDGKHRGVLP